MDYTFKLMDKQGFEIDTTILYNCLDRIEAILKVNKLMLSQGLKINRFKYSLKQLNK